MRESSFNRQKYTKKGRGMHLILHTLSLCVSTLRNLQKNLIIPAVSSLALARRQKPSFPPLRTAIGYASPRNLNPNYLSSNPTKVTIVVGIWSWPLHLDRNTIVGFHEYLLFNLGVHCQESCKKVPPAETQLNTAAKITALNLDIFLSFLKFSETKNKFSNTEFYPPLG